MRDYDLIVLGAGTGNMLFGPELSHLKAAIVESDRFGGTCLNRGCIPSKMFVLAADAARGVRAAQRLGVHATLDHVDWPAIRDRVFGRIDPIHEKARRHRVDAGIDVYDRSARFIAPNVLDVGGETITAPNIVVAVGSRPIVPPIPGLDRTPYHTSDTIMRVEETPESMIIIGGGFIAAEMGHVFEAFGTEVTILARGPRLLMAEDEDISTRFTELAVERFDVRFDAEIESVSARDGQVSVRFVRDDVATTVHAAALLLATGRRPNTDLLDVAAGGLQVDEHGHLVTDGAYRTNVPGVWGLGDAVSHFQLKHMANAEGRVVAHNLAHPDDLRALRNPIAPHAVFGEPQIASVGLTEQQARRDGIRYVAATRGYSRAAYGWALEDEMSFVKILADPTTRMLLGAHIIGPQAPTLLQPLVQAMMLGQTVDQLAREVIYIHPALTEVVEQALLEL